MSVAVPVPPSIRMSQTTVATGNALTSVSVIVGFAACPVPFEVIVQWQVWLIPATAVTVAVVPNPALRASSPLVQAVPWSAMNSELRVVPAAGVNTKFTFPNGSGIEIVRAAAVADGVIVKLLVAAVPRTIFPTGFEAVPNADPATNGYNPPVPPEISHLHPADGQRSTKFPLPLKALFVLVILGALKTP